MVIAVADLDGTIVGCGGCRIPRYSALMSRRPRRGTMVYFTARCERLADLNGRAHGDCGNESTISFGPHSRSIRRESMVRSDRAIFHLYTHGPSSSLQRLRIPGSEERSKERGIVFPFRKCGIIVEAARSLPDSESARRRGSWTTMVTAGGNTGFEVATQYPRGQVLDQGVRCRISSSKKSTN